MSCQNWHFVTVLFSRGGLSLNNNAIVIYVNIGQGEIWFNQRLDSSQHLIAGYEFVVSRRRVWSSNSELLQHLIIGLGSFQFPILRGKIVCAKSETIANATTLRSERCTLGQFEFKRCTKSCQLDLSARFSSKILP